jgi:glycerate-2-kinase
MPTIAEFLARLDRDELDDLSNALIAGSGSASLAVECLRNPVLQTNEVSLLLMHLTRAIEQLEAVRELVRRRG